MLWVQLKWLISYKKLKKMTNLIFDYDGTIHNTIEIYRPAFLKAVERLNKLNKIEYKDYTNENIEKWLGLTATQMWNEFAPYLSDEDKNVSSSIIGQEMIMLTHNGKAKLYNNAETVLKTIKDRGYRLILLSNCKTDYLDTHNLTFGLDKYFEKLYPAQKYNFMPKYEIFNIIKEDLQGDFISIGDRYVDIEIATKNGFKSVGCSYGYGKDDELNNADIRINDISELLHIFTN